MKEIPDDKIYHFKSCVMGTFFPGSEKSLLYIYEKLRLDFVDDDAQTSCMGFCYHSGIIPWKTNLAVNARNMSLAEVQGRNIVCVCPTSYGNLKECRKALENAETRGEVNKALSRIKRSYQGGANIYHASELVYACRDRLREMAEFNLKGIRVATHHGCHYSKIFYQEVASGEWERPTVLDEIAEAFGGEVVEYQERGLCCGMGFHHLLMDREYTRQTAFRKLASIDEAKPDFILTNCPGCQMILDYMQPAFRKETGSEMNVPVLNYAQLVALLLCADPVRVVGIRTHVVSPEKIVERLRHE